MPIDSTTLIIFGILAVIALNIIIKSKKSPSKPSKPDEPEKKSIEPKVELLSELDIEATEIPSKPEKTVDNGEKFPYILTNSVFTNNESKFYNALIRIAYRLGLTVFTKIRMADLIYIPKNHPEYIRWFNYIRSKHIDFIICNSEGKPVLLIELDDYTHDRASRQKRDEFVNKIFSQLNLPLLHVREWREEELEKHIKEALNITAIIN